MRWWAAVAVSLIASPVAAKTYPDPQAPSVPLTEWQRDSAVRVLETDFAEAHLRIPVQAVTGVKTRGGDPERVVSVSVEATLPDLRTAGSDTLERFRQPLAPDVLRLRLYADLPRDLFQRMEKTLAQSVTGGVYREVTTESWKGLRLFAMADAKHPPVMEGFYEADARRRYVECRLAGPHPGCSASYQRDDGLTVEYSFGLGYLDRMAWLDAQVSGLLAGFVIGDQQAQAR